MSKLALLTDIQTILKLIKYNQEFKYRFLKCSFLTTEYKTHIENYITKFDLTSKEVLWGVLSTIDYIPEINYVLRSWRNNTAGHEKIEASIELMEESEFGHSIIGKVIEFDNIADKYKKLITEEKRQRFQYNGFKLLSNGQAGHLQLFY